MNRPKLHVTPKENWMNDPNGFIYYKGKYHLFYQHFPFAPHWGTMHWGHKISDDLLHWEDLGIALYPDREFDANGCFSGTALEVDGKMNLYYTAILYDEIDPANPHVTAHALLASQAMITSEDGFSFDPAAKKIVVPMFPLEADETLVAVEDETSYGNAGNVRDPKVWKHGDKYYMLLGSQHPQDRPSKTRMQGELLLYTSEDAIHFTFAKVFRFPHIDTEMFECPDLFSVDGQDFFITSPFGDVRPDKEYKDNAYIAKASLDYDALDLRIGDLSLIDYGQDYYAPQTTVDAEGNRILIGWLRMPEALTDDATGEKWIGAFTFPRILRFQSGMLTTDVHPNVKKAFAEEVFLEACPAPTPPGLKQCFDYALPEGPLRIEATLKEGDCLHLGDYSIFFRYNRVETDRERCFGDYEKIANHFATPALCQSAAMPACDFCHVSIYLDGPIVEVYVNEGQFVISNVIYKEARKLYANLSLPSSLQFFVP